MQTTPLILKKNEARRLRGGHLWVFSNEIDTSRSELKSIEPGQAVEILDEQGKFIAHARAHIQHKNRDGRER